jgi:hypothetical protein
MYLREVEVALEDSVEGHPERFGFTGDNFHSGENLDGSGLTAKRFLEPR